tara:strand:+ start:131749 stop:132531 length:783 start_codon:yes stop_codon:yes gene_type:complete
MRIAAGIEYSGQSYSGWQRQESVNSVQAEVEQAFSFVANEKIDVYCAGRTDAAVHATGQVIHFDTDAVRSERSWLCGANTQLPRDIAVQWVKIVDEEFHARFSALTRRYQYYIYCGSARPGILSDNVTWCLQDLNLDAMQAASNFLLGKHDFTSFRASQCQANTPVRTVHAMSWQRKGQLLMLDIRANAFLHHMVRNIVGLMLTVGKGEQGAEWAKEILEAKNRELAPATAASNGLYLVEVEYPSTFKLPAMRKSAWFDL